MVFCGLRQGLRDTDWQEQHLRFNRDINSASVPLYSTKETRQSGYRVRRKSKHEAWLSTTSVLSDSDVRLACPEVRNAAHVPISHQNCRSRRDRWPLVRWLGRCRGCSASDVKWMVLGKHMSSGTFIPSPCTINQLLSLRTVEQVFTQTVMSATVKNYNDTAHYSCTKGLFLKKHLGMPHSVSGAFHGKDAVLVGNKACLFSQGFLPSSNRLLPVGLEPWRDDSQYCPFRCFTLTVFFFSYLSFQQYVGISNL